MYIPEFWVGFIGGVLVGVALLIVMALVVGKSEDDDDYPEEDEDSKDGD